MSPLRRILGNGYFPKELPPPFHTVSFATYADNKPAAMDLKIAKKDLKTNAVTRPAVHNLARAGTLRRKLTIPNPINQYQVTKIITENWLAIKKACKRSPYSLTTPRYSKHGARAILPQHGFEAIPVARARSRIASRYNLSTDISQFYQSIYTHTIAWALHTKTVAKRYPTDYSLLGNLLDLAVRNGQDKQTVGIPIGPDTSLVIAEILLSHVDAQMGGSLASRGYRFIDDINCGFGSIAEAEDTLGMLQSLIGDLQLQLNPKKTNISSLPVDLEASWVPHLRLFVFRSTSAVTQQTDILSYFGRAFELASVQPDEAILRYSVQRMRSVSVRRENWGLYETLLLQCMSVEPGTVAAVISELYRYHHIMPINRNRVAECLHVRVFKTLCQLISPHRLMYSSNLPGK